MQKTYFTGRQYRMGNNSKYKKKKIDKNSRMAVILNEPPKQMSEWQTSESEQHWAYN